VTTEAKPAGLTWMAKLVLVLIVGLLVAGALRPGTVFDAWHRFWTDLFERPGGPMSLRFLLQPLMATIAAFKDGTKDAKTGRSPYFWTVLSSPGERTARLSEGLVSTAQIILMGIVIDAIYQLKVFGTFYPVEALFCALALAFVPYLLLRGPIARFQRRRLARTAA
jgi:hypothetical protein